MNPALKEYLDSMHSEFMAAQATLERKIDAQSNQLSLLLCSWKPDLDTASCVTEPVQANSGMTELVLASTGLADTPAPVVASPVVAPATPIDTIAVLPASCSTECAAQAVTASTTTTLLPWVSVSSAASPATSVTCDVISTKLASHNDDDERSVPLDSSSVDGVPFSVALFQWEIAWQLAALDMWFHTDNLQALVARQGPQTVYFDANLLSIMPVGSVESSDNRSVKSAVVIEEIVDLELVDTLQDDFAFSPSEDVPALDEVQNAVTKASDSFLQADPASLSPEDTSMNSVLVSPDDIDTVGATAVPFPAPPQEASIILQAPFLIPLKVCWRSAPPSFLMEIFSPKGIFSLEGSGSFAVQSVTETVLVCNDDEGFLAYVLSDKLLQHDNVQWKSWPRPLSLFEYCQEGVPFTSLMVQSWLGPSARPQSYAQALSNKFLVSVKLLADPSLHPLYKFLLLGYHGCADSCCLLWTSGQERHVFDTAAEQPKSRWLSGLTQVDTEFEKGVHPSGEVITLNSKTTLAAPDSRIPQYTRSNRRLTEVKPPDGTHVLLLYHHSNLGLVILDVLVAWQHFSMGKITGLSSNEISSHADPMSSVDNLLLQRHITQYGFDLFQWNIIQYNLDYPDSTDLKVPQFPWDPGGSERLDSSTTTAWGQAVTQGEGDVSAHPSRRGWSACWASSHCSWRPRRWSNPAR